MSCDSVDFNIKLHRELVDNLQKHLRQLDLDFRNIADTVHRIVNVTDRLCNGYSTWLCEQCGKAAKHEA